MQSIKVAVYTRHTDQEGYTPYLGNSIHLAYSNDGKPFEALHQNYGILFAKAVILADNTLQAMGLLQPRICLESGGIYRITATRVLADGSPDESSAGKRLLWRSENLIHFSDEQWIDAAEDAEMMATCSHEKTLLKDFSGVTGAIPGNAVLVEKPIADRLLTFWNPLVNTNVTVPDTIVASCSQDIDRVSATLHYLDGSIATKKVNWQTEHVNFQSPGIYPITGIIQDEGYKFPLLEGFADPDVFYFKGDYYYIATNDTNGNKGFHVRKASTFRDLFAPDTLSHLILDVDPERNLLQTFWAPEFHEIGGSLYILFAVGAEVWGPQCYMMRLKPNGSIIRAEDWEDPVRVTKQDGSYLAGGDSITLDMTYFSVHHRDYVMWSYRIHTGTPKDSGSMLYIATINPAQPWVLTSEPVLISRPLYGWENIDGTINNEGPYAIITDAHVYITYSGGAAGGYSYAMGLLTARMDADLLHAACWTKSTAPVLSYYSVPGEYGPGHNAAFTDTNGQLIMTYHAQCERINSPRCSGARRIHFDARDYPRFDVVDDTSMTRHPLRMQVVVP